MRDWAPYRRREADQVILSLTSTEAVEILALVLGVTLAERDGDQRSAVTLLSAKLAAASPS